MGKIYQVREFEIDEKNLQLQETIFHNANGYIGVRGTLEEGVPKDWDTMRGTYINGFYDIAPMKQAEKLCNLIEDKESMLNTADTQTIEINFGGQPFSMIGQKRCSCTRTLDMEKGITNRKVDWVSEEGKQVNFDITRMASFEERSLFTIDYRFWSVDFDGIVEIHSKHLGLVKNYFNPKDPRLAGECHEHLKKEEAHKWESGGCLVSATARSNLKVASGAVNVVMLNHVHQEANHIGYDETVHKIDAFYRFRIKPGDEVRILKYSIFEDSIRHEDCLKVAEEKLALVVEQGIDYYYEKQKDFLKEFWNNSTLEIMGDEELNASVCFNMYQLLQSAGYDGYSSIAAKGLSGEGYEGHYFWDTEMFMVPYFALTNPKIARKLLEFRYKTLNQAKDNAKLLGHKKGVLFPWRTITGRECSGYYPSGTAQYHIDGDIAYAVILYYKATGDWTFMKEMGMKILLETNRLWLDVGNFCKGQFHINCVTGPDEYTCMVNNNYFTNACAKYSLEWFGKLAERFAKEEAEWKRFAEENRLTDAELKEMEAAQDEMFLPYDEELGINPQDDSFLQKPIWDLAHTDKENFPLLLHYHPLHLYRYQVCKQADTVLAHYLFPDYQDRQTEEKSFLYYEKITTHDSSLSTCVFSIVASKLGLKEKAYRYFGDSAKMDLLNTHKNTKDGIHAANMGGCYMAIVNGFAMLRAEEEKLILAPSLPKAWEGYRFRIRYHGSLLEISVGKRTCRIERMEGAAVPVELYG
ncbi:MAG: family 65 glycosyl hydrolase, partial [Lachnospiraceae bacterium]|nr:family 65 glycosyl hydrolase [Lachnospiraceae bacterium]